MYLFLQIFTLPVIVYYFNFIPVMGLFYNLMLLPVFTVIMIYGFMLLIFNPLLHALLKLPFEIFDYILYTLRYIIDLSDKFGFNGLIFPTMSICHILFFYLAKMCIRDRYNGVIMSPPAFQNNRILLPVFF